MPGDSAILIWLLALPAAGCAAVFALPEALVKRPWLGARAVALAFGIATLIVAGLAGGRVDYGATGWGGQLAVNIGAVRLGVDGFSMPLALLAAGMGVIAGWGSYGIKRGEKRYYVLLQLWMLAVLGVLTARDGMEMCACLVGAVLVLYFLLAGWGTERKVAAARRYLYFALPALAAVVTAAARPSGLGVGGVGGAFWLMVGGLGVLAGLVPMHWWLPDVVAEASTPVGMLTVGVMQTLGGYGMLRMGGGEWSSGQVAKWLGGGAGRDAWGVGVVAAVTMAYGTLAAVGARDLKRMAAFASVALMGFFVLGLALGTPASITGAAYLLVGHGVAVGMLVFVAGMIEERVGHCEFQRMGGGSGWGLAGHMPVFAGWSAVAILGALGMPGLCVFAGELLVVMGTFAHGSVGGEAGETPALHGEVEGGAGFVWLGVVGVLSMIVLLGCGVWTYNQVFLGEKRAEHANVARMSISEKWILAVLGAGVVALGIVPALLTEPLRGAVEGWLRGR